MNHYADPAFHECMYIHYAHLLGQPAITAAQREFYLDKQNHYAACYTIAMQAPIYQIYHKILNIVNMQTESLQPIAADAILHMARIIQKRELENQPCILHCNEHRICLTDSENVILAWTKTKTA